MSDGHTLNESEAIVAQDQTFYQNGKSEFMPITLSDKGELKSAMARDEINRFMDYAVNISELATSQLKEGVIVPSPYEKVCEYCEFKGICKQEKQLERKVKSVSAQTIVEAQKE